jgi:hypothetical protein
MKQSIILILFSFLTYSNLFSQTIENIENENKKLINEIKEFPFIQSWCLGFSCNSISLVYRKTDSLFALSTPSEVISYFQDTSYVLKYYSFMYALENNDSIAYKLLEKSINDTTLVSTNFSCVYSSHKFNHLLIYEYRRFIEMKYKTGGRIYKGDLSRTYTQPKSKHKWKEKSKQLNKLLKTKKIDLR